jgi:hypothetical protein
VSIKLLTSFLNDPNQLICYDLTHFRASPIRLVHLTVIDPTDFTLGFDNKTIFAVGWIHKGIIHMGTVWPTLVESLSNFTE